MPAEGGATGCPTIFPAPPALGASFNTTLMTAIGVAISDEVRAMNNAYGSRNYANRPIDLNLWLPSINLNINYLWGRNVEVYGEDPLLAGRMAGALVRGVQWNGASGPGAAGLKVYATIKHYTGYQVESNRFAFDTNVSERDLVMTYLLPFQIAAAEGGNVGAMCAYPSLNGVPMCGSPVLETGVLREEFGMGLAGMSYIQADCGAVGNMHSQHHYVDSDVEAAALALNSGTDIDCAGTMPDNLAAALAANLTTEATLDASVSRVLGLSFLAGRFDPLAGQPYTRIPLSAVGSPAHAALSFDAALQGMVLLRNDGSLLPLAPGRALAVVGPFAANQGDLAGNYYEDICSNATSDASCVPSIFTALAAANAGGETALEPGCDMVDASKQNISGAVAVAAAADVVVLALGINSQVCNEGTDRTTLSLPGAQPALAAAVLALGKPTIVLLVAGAVLDVAAIAANPAAQTAIVLGGPPGNQGGAPIAAALFGAANRWGRTTLSHYLAANLSEALPPQGYDMAAPPGRTYKYTTLPVQWPFGAGLSYTTFSVVPLGAAARAAGSAAALDAAPAYRVNVTNTGAREGDAVVLVFIEPAAVQFPGGNDTLARQVLADFARVSLARGESAVLSFDLGALAFAQADAAGDLLLAPGRYVVRVTDDTGRRGAGDALFALDVALDGAAAQRLRESPLRRARARYG